MEIKITGFVDGCRPANTLDLVGIDWTRSGFASLVLQCERLAVVAAGSDPFLRSSDSDWK